MTFIDSLHSHELVVADAHLDELGHVNNARYLEYLEEARMAWYDTSGMVQKTCEEREVESLNTVVVNVNIDFVQECMAGETLKVTTHPARAGGKSYVLEQSIYKADGELAARASVTSVVMDLRSRRAVPMAKSARGLFAEH